MEAPDNTVDVKGLTIADIDRMEKESIRVLELNMDRRDISTQVYINIKSRHDKLRELVRLHD